MADVAYARDFTETEGRGIYSPSLSEVVEAIGRDTFADELLYLLNGAVGADHCTVFQFANYELLELGTASLQGAGAIWKSDLTQYEVKKQLSQVGSSSARVDVYNIPSSVAGPSKRQRVMICAQRGQGSFCIRVLRSEKRPALSASEMQFLRSLADLIISLVVRHVDIYVSHSNVTPALTSLDVIQDCVSGETDLSRRESEVCARILYGLSSCGIALDLGIGKESVMTYRKRAYQRLGIGSQRELLMWYLSLWSATRGAKPGEMVVN